MKIIPVSIIAFCLLTGWPAKQVSAQPYLDLLSVRYVNSPGDGLAKDNSHATQLNYFSASATLPIQFRNRKDALVLSPFFEAWSSRVGSVSGFQENHYGIGLPVSLVKTIPNSRWSLLSTAILRMNDAFLGENGAWQFGGAMVGAEYNKNARITYKFGLYANTEFFGLFIIPLVGLDWQISEKTSLFGILPASLTLEHRVVKSFYSGFVFRTFTNSYHDSAAQYIRIDENQLGLFLDYYPARHIVVNLEAGHSLFRKIRSGTRNNIGYSWGAENNFYFKVMVAYRLRLR